MTRVTTMAEAAEHTGLIYHRADEGDWLALVSLRLGAERRLRELGVSQWADTARGLERMWQRVVADEMYVVREHASARGCFSLTENGDPDFWSGDPELREFLYLHTVIAAPAAAGTGVGSYITQMAMSEAAARGLLGVRLDYWRANGRLREIWEGHGFTYLETAEVPGRDSGGKMERRLSAAPAV